MNRSFNKTDSDNNSDGKFKTENKFLKDKVKTLEQIIEDKNEIINLLKKEVRLWMRNKQI